MSENDDKKMEKEETLKELFKDITRELLTHMKTNQVGDWEDEPGTEVSLSNRIRN